MKICELLVVEDDFFTNTRLSLLC